MGIASVRRQHASLLTYPHACVCSSHLGIPRSHAALGWLGKPNRAGQLNKERACSCDAHALTGLGRLLPGQVTGMLLLQHLGPVLNRQPIQGIRGARLRLSSNTTQ